MTGGGCTRIPHGDCNWTAPNIASTCSDATRTPHGDCNLAAKGKIPKSYSRRNPHPSRGQFYTNKNGVPLMWRAIFLRISLYVLITHACRLRIPYALSCRCPTRREGYGWCQHCCLGSALCKARFLRDIARQITVSVNTAYAQSFTPHRIQTVQAHEVGG